jgi:hypothetical protein
MLAGLVADALVLRIAAPPETAVHKGKVLPVRYDPARFRLVPKDVGVPKMTGPGDAMPSMRESR